MPTVEGGWTHSIEHAHDVFCVREGADFLVALPVDYGERLQAQALHRDFGRKQKAMVELVEELVPREKERKEHEWHYTGFSVLRSHLSCRLTIS